MRFMDWIMALVVLAGILWAAVPSSVFLDPIAVYYDGRTVTLVRRTPYGPVQADWSRELHVVGTELECHAPSILVRIRPVDGDIGEDGKRAGENTIIYDAGDWALPCLRSEPPIIATHTWQVKVLGLIPLRPVRITGTIERQYEG